MKIWINSYYHGNINNTTSPKKSSESIYARIAKAVSKAWAALKGPKPAVEVEMSQFAILETYTSEVKVIHLFKGSKIRTFREAYLDQNLTAIEKIAAKRGVIVSESQKPRLREMLVQDNAAWPVYVPENIKNKKVRQFMNGQLAIFYASAVQKLLSPRYTNR